MNEQQVTLVAVDDDPAALELITEALSELDVEVLTSTDPEEGLQLIIRHAALLKVATDRGEDVIKAFEH